jgi:hypothetical protein
MDQRWVVAALTFPFLMTWTWFAAALAQSDQDGERFFREKIEPVLKRECFDCHSTSANQTEAGLSLDAPDRIAQGGDSGPAIDLRNPTTSLILQAVRHQSGLKMPLDRSPLPESFIADLERWIHMGAPDPRPKSQSRESDPLDKVRAHWAFRPLGHPVLPEAKDGNQVDHPLDAFLLDSLEQKGWTYAGPASKQDWLRRVTFDVTGLPPSAEELEQFLSDPAPDAFSRVVDRLLASPAYGEKSGQLWLDVVRYAESEGYEYDRHLPDAWRYRDYVVASFNASKPYNQFVAEQIAGDELDPNRYEFLTAAVFHRLGPVRRNAGNPDIALSRNEVLTERTDILGAAFLGMTIGCARCHNHKLEPITQKDYYQLQAYLAATDEHNFSLAAKDEQDRWDARTAQLKSEIKSLQQLAKKAEGAEKEKLSEQIEKLDDQLPEPLATIPSIRNDAKERTDIHVLRRGVWEHKGVQVSPRPPSILVPEDFPSLSLEEARPRMYLAQWMVDQDNPLTPRVIVNRIWQQHFGAGIVRTANDLGLNGERPSHPELLDWLARDLLEHEWDIKSLHRSILLSRAYRQGSRPQASDTTEHGKLDAARRLDPDNRLLSHFPRRRLSSEELRDTMLFVSGQLQRQVGGQSVMLPVDPEMVQLLYKPSQWTPTKDPSDHGRRSIYLFAKRNLRLTFMENLDAPPMLCSCAKRESSTHAPQALELMNGEQSNRWAERFASRLLSDSREDRRRLVELAFRRGLGRAPDQNEYAVCLPFLEQQSAKEFALALFNLNEFLYVP